VCRAAGPADELSAGAAAAERAQGRRRIDRLAPGEFDPADLRGDLAGVERRLDDVQGGPIGPAGPPTIAFCRSPGRADAL